MISISPLSHVEEYRTKGSNDRIDPLSRVGLGTTLRIVRRLSICVVYLRMPYKRFRRTAAWRHFLRSFGGWYRDVQDIHRPDGGFASEARG